jgi:hypothetical protein
LLDTKRCYVVSSARVQAFLEQINNIPVNTPDPSHVSVTVTPTFWEVYLASLAMMRFNLWLIPFRAVFPLAGLFILIAPFLLGRSFGAQNIFLAMLAFFFTPLVTALNVWQARRRNKLAEGPLIYLFDSEGLHTTGGAFSQTIKWTAIRRVRQTKRFLFFFISPSRALYIPRRAVTDPESMNTIVALASANSDFRY